MYNEAILVMDSRASLGPTRSQAAGFDWTRLYQSEYCFLDLWLQRTPGGAVLLGRVISEELSQTLVGYVATKFQDPIRLDTEGNFKLNLEPGIHDLHLHLGGDVIAVRGLAA